MKRVACPATKDYGPKSKGFGPFFVCANRSAKHAKNDSSGQRKRLHYVLRSSRVVPELRREVAETGLFGPNVPASEAVTGSSREAEDSRARIRRTVAGNQCSLPGVVLPLVSCDENQPRSALARKARCGIEVSPLEDLRAPRTQQQQSSRRDAGPGSDERGGDDAEQDEHTGRQHQNHIERHCA